VLFFIVVWVSSSTPLLAQQNKAQMLDAFIRETMEVSEIIPSLTVVVVSENETLFHQKETFLRIK
jgi:hypothetical protein